MLLVHNYLSLYKEKYKSIVHLLNDSFVQIIPKLT